MSDRTDEPPDVVADRYLRTARTRLKRAEELIRRVEWTEEATETLESRVEMVDEALALLKAELRRRP